MKRITALLAALLMLLVSCGTSPALPASDGATTVLTGKVDEKTTDKTGTVLPSGTVSASSPTTETQIPSKEPTTETPAAPSTTATPTLPTDTPTPTTETPTPPTDTPTPTTETPTPPTDTPTPTTETPIPSTETPSPTTETPSEPFTPFTIAFTGDISYADTYYVGSSQRSGPSSGIYYHALATGKSLSSLIDSAMLARMKAADLLVVNCESSVSERGTPLGLSGKAYSFRTSPKNAKMFAEIGADLIGLANNHVYDFGKDAFLDTLSTFESMGLPTVGAGRNEAEAYEPYYYTQSGVTVALIATSCAENEYYTIVAEGDVPGICGCYDTAAVCAKIREAKTKADFVIVYPHYGIEYSTDVISPKQKQVSYDFIDAGADLIVGTHAHCLQGIETYKGKFIFYNLGNFLFNAKTIETMLLELTFVGRGEYTLRIMPATQIDGTVRSDFGTSVGVQTLDFMRKRSYGIAIDRDGYVYDCKV